MVYDAIVIGAGQAGLAAGYYLQQAGLHFLILEAGDEPVGSWPRYYDSLSLNSPARYSSLPGLPFPGHPDHYPSRDETVAYLRSYVAHFRLPVATRARVANVERIGQLFRLTTDDQRCYWASTVVAATGFFDRPNLPDLPGQAEFQGRLLHVSAYRRPEPFQGQRIVIVGGGNAAVQIGIELAEVAQVTLATRRPIRYLPQRLLGRDIHFWFGLTGLEHTQWLKDQSNPVYDTGKYRAAIEAGKPDRKPMFQRLTHDGVIWSDGSYEQVDTILFATGYQANPAYLAGLNVLDEAGRVLQQTGVSTQAPGLYFVGLPRQRNVASATLRGVGADAKIVVRHLRRYTAQQQATSGELAGQWSTRGSEFVGLLNLLTFSFKEQIARQPNAAPRLIGETLIRTFTMGVGLFGFGNAAPLYAYRH